MDKTYIGIDNGVTGTIGIVRYADKARLLMVPTKKVQDYTKAKKNITRLDAVAFKALLEPFADNCMVVMERPMVNPQRFTATASALRCLEAELVVIEDLGIPYMFIDSKEWQRAMLPKGIKGSEEQKRSSLDIGNRLFPEFKDFKHSDRDGILIAEYARRIQR